CGRGGDDVGPDRACSGAGATPLGVDLDAAEAARADQDGVGKVAERGGAVACALRGDAEAVLGREPYGAGDVLRDLRLEDRDGLLVDGEVPRLPRLVPGCVAGEDDVAVAAEGGIAEV